MTFAMIFYILSVLLALVCSGFIGYRYIQTTFEIWDAEERYKKSLLGGDFELKPGDLSPPIAGAYIPVYEEELKISDFHIGFVYEELELDSERYLNQGLIWKRKIYSFESPRLFKINQLLQEGKLRRAQ